MDDTQVCPICGSKLRNITKMSEFVLPIAKFGDFVERICTGPNHVIQFFTDLTTGKVDFLKVSLNYKYSRFIEINYVDQYSRVITLKNNKPEYIIVPKIIEPDFPDLNLLREKVGLFVVFS